MVIHRVKSYLEYNIQTTTKNNEKNSFHRLKKEKEKTTNFNSTRQNVTIIYYFELEQ